MTTKALTAPICAPGELAEALRTQGRAVIAPDGLVHFARTTTAELDALRPSWDRLPLDAHLRDGGRYRRRRHASFVVGSDPSGESEAYLPWLMPQRAHWQPVEYNALHGGLERWFEPIEEQVLEAPAWNHLLMAFAGLLNESNGVGQPWFVEAHQFRIDTTDGIGRPTPEGAHRDGVDLVAVVLVGRDGIKGGETRVFDADGPSGMRFTMLEPWTTLILDDARVIHESTPIQPLESYGYRDTLVLTYRGGGFRAVGLIFIRGNP